MTTPIASDLFNRANTSSGLGTADTGQSWSALIGTMQIAGYRARSASSSRAAAVVNAGVGGGNSTVDAACGYGNGQGGYALYFRVSDASNWWRLGVNASSYTYTSGSHQEYYTYISSWTCYLTSASGTQPGFSSGYDASYPWNGFYSQSCSPNYATGSTTVTDYSTAYSWSLVLQKCVAGVVTTVATSGDLGAAPTHLQVIANGAAIQAFCSTTSSGMIALRATVLDSFNQAATLHGVGYGETTSFGNSDGLDNFTISVANTAPNAPILTGPSNNAPVDRNLTQRLPWAFSDPDAGDSQSAFNLRYKQGTDPWTVITGLLNPWWDAPPATFVLGPVELQVRTYDAAGLVGPYCASSVFVAANAPNTPSITTPISGSTVNAAANVTWSTTTQNGYQVRTVADDAGIADPTTVYYDTGEVTDAAVRTISVVFAVNSRYEHIQVRIKDGGLWSQWADCRVPVAWTPPAIPILTFTPDPGTASILVQITNPTPTGEQAVVSYNDIYVASWYDIEHLAATVPPNGSWLWRLPASMRVYQIHAFAVGVNGTTADSDNDTVWIDGGTFGIPADSTFDGGIL